MPILTLLSSLMVMSSFPSGVRIDGSFYNAVAETCHNAPVYESREGTRLARIGDGRWSLYASGGCPLDTPHTLATASAFQYPCGVMDWEQAGAGVDMKLECVH